MSLRRVLRMRGLGNGSLGQYNHFMDLLVEKRISEAPMFIDEHPPAVDMTVFAPLMRMILAKYSPPPQVTVKWPWNLAEDLAFNSEVARFFKESR